MALASPATLLAMLKGLAFAWRQDLLTENARDMFVQSRELYERLGTMGTHVAKLGSSLRGSVEKYNAFVGTLESRVLPSARRIRDLDPGLGEGHDPAAALHQLPLVEAAPRGLSAAELLDRPPAPPQYAPKVLGPLERPTPLELLEPLEELDPLEEQDPLGSRAAGS